VLSIPYAVCADWPGDLHRLKQEWGVTLVAAESHARAVPLWELPCADRMAIVLGSEGHGISEAALAHCDHVCEIPMAPGVP
jgi:tRNA G18 (ribose-2'-O)-methylase SpoU